VREVARELFGSRAPRKPKKIRATARRREEKHCRGVYMIQQVAAEHLGWGRAPSLNTKKQHMNGKYGAT